MKDSKIEWTDHTFNPWQGCTKVSPGCLNCYAETLNHRWGRDNWGRGKPRIRTSEAYWKQPFRWQKQLMDDEWCGDSEMIYKAPRVFCASLADWLDAEVPIQWFVDLLSIIHRTPRLDWLLLTKRPENWGCRLHEALRAAIDPGLVFEGWLSQWLDGEFPNNVWVGTSVEDQTRANVRIQELLKIPARIRFLSCEPLLEEVNLETVPFVARRDKMEFGVHWVICGGESGRGKRPFDAAWARSLRDQCDRNKVPFFMKQIDKVQPIPGDLMIRQFPL